MFARRGKRDERGSLPMAMLVVMIGIVLCTALVPVTINQRKAVTLTSTRVHSLNAAQAGIDALVGKIRNAYDTNGGEPTELPCTNDAQQNPTPMTGSVSGDTASYSVVVKYFVVDPVAHAGSTPMKCVSGSGTYDSATGSVVPRYAQITSTGTDGVDASNPDGGSRGRSLTSIYAFDVDNQNISGGIIKSYPGTGDGSDTYCLDVGDGTPTANLTTVSIALCSATYPPAAQQVFAYRDDLTLQLVTSIGSVVGGVTYANGLCIDIKNTTNSNTVPASGSPLVLQQCGADKTNPVWSQQWSFDDYSSLQAPKATTGTTSTQAGDGVLSGLCMTVDTTRDGNNVPVAHKSTSLGITLGTCDRSLTSAADAWIPSPAVGAGAATKTGSMQWINFQQFGRCINSPGAVTNPPYLIAPGCKQNPKQGAVNWNQKLTYQGGQFYYTTGGRNYCLYSQGTGAGTDPYVLLTQCDTHPGVTLLQMQWARITPATDTNNTPYSQLYRFVDYQGNCMSLKNVATNDAYTVWPKVITTTCDYSTLQQWNASNTVGDSSLQNTREN